MKRLPFLLAVLLAGFAAPVASFAQTCTTSWTNAAGGAWADAANWSSGVPGASDDACITLDGTYTVTTPSYGGFTVGSLALGNAVNTGKQTLFIDGAFSLGTTGTIGESGIFEWAGNYANFTSGTLTNEGLARLTGFNPGVQGSALFINNATVEQGSGNLHIENGGRVENAALWDLQADGDLSGGGTASAFVNTATGTFRKSGGTGTTSINYSALTFENAGTIDVQSGNLNISRPSTHTNATLTASSGAFLGFYADALFAGTTTGNPSGTVRLESSFHADSVAGATWDLGGTGMEWGGNYANLTQGTLTNEGLVRLTGYNPGVQGSALFINNATVEQGSGNLHIENGGRVENAALWDLQDDGNLYGGGAASTFVNKAAGTFRKSGGTGTTSINYSALTFENAGIVSAESGTIVVSRPFDHQAGALLQGTAQFQISAGASFTQNGNTGPGISSGQASGILSWVGPWKPSNGSTFFVEIAGTGGAGASNGHDQLAIAGAATLGGALDVNLINPVSDGDTFVILTATGGVTGTFDTPSPFYAGNGLIVEILYNANDVTLRVEQLEADYAVTKTVSNATPSVGDLVTFTVTLKNNGPNDDGDLPAGIGAGLVVQDAAPAGLDFACTGCSVTPSAGSYDAGSGDWTLDALANGASETLTIVAQVTQAGSLTNTATLTASELPDSDDSNDSASASVDGQAADLAVTKTASTTAALTGQPFTYTVMLTNNGPSNATGIVVKDEIPAGLVCTDAASAGTYNAAAGTWSVASLASGADATLTFTCTAAAVGSYTNTATRQQSSPVDLDDSNDSASVTVNVSASVTIADLGLTKTVSADSVEVGDQVTFVVTLTNSGPNLAESVKVTDAAPTGLTFDSATPSKGSYSMGTGIWSVASLAADSSATLTIVATVTKAGTMTNTARITASDQADPNPDNNTASATVKGKAGYDACDDPSTAPSYAGGYVTNSAGTRAFLEITIPQGGTEFLFYNLNNLVVGNPEADAENGTALTGFTRAGNAFSFSPASPTSAFFPITTASTSSRVAFFLKVTDTCGRTVDVDPQFALDATSEHLEGFVLAQAFPNPAAGVATIRFSLDEAGPARLAIYDVLGREVAVAMEGDVAPGEGSVRLDTDALPSGLYVYRLEAGGRQLTRTFTVAH